MVDVYDKVKIVIKEFVIIVNEGYYDMVNRKIRVKGNVYVDYIGDKLISVIFNDMIFIKKK